MASATSALRIAYSPLRVRSRFFYVFALWMGVAAAVPGSAIADEVVVLSFGGAAEDAEQGNWLPARLADLIAEKLELLGVPTRDRRFDAREHAAAIVGGRVEPKSALDPAAPISVELDLSVGTAKPAKKKLTAKAGELEKLAGAIAVEVAAALGQKISEPLRAKLEVASYPFAVHRTLGLARAHFDAGAFRKAMVMYDRAGELTKVGTIPEAVEGRLIAESELVGRGEATYAARADLAPPAAVRFEVAKKNKDDKEAIRALEGYLKSTPDRALRWKIEAPLDRATSTLLAHGQKWVLQAGEGEKKRWTLDPRTGAITARDPGLRGLVSIAGGHTIVVEHKTLSRLDETGRAKWKLALPVAPRGLPIDSVVVGSGVAAVIGEREVAWVEISFGELGQRAKNVRPLASSEAGVLVELGVEGEQSELGLLRPGKKAPAWTAKVATPLDAALTGDRVLLVTRSELIFLRALDGKEAGRPIALPAPSAKIVGVDGRYAVLDYGPELGTAIFDALGSEQTALVRGPGAPVAAYTAANGVAIAFASGDVVFFERDGRVLDRARAPGKMIELVAGDALAPGPVAVTSRGMFAYAEVSPDRMRDVDAILELAELLLRAGEEVSAMRIAEWVASRSAGGVERAELLRARIAEKRGDTATAKLARDRASAARDLTKPLSAFSLLAN